MTWNTIRLIVVCVFAVASLLLMLYTRHLERQLDLASKRHSTEHVVGMILCKLLVDSGMSEQEIQDKVNAELSKISKERR